MAVSWGVLFTIIEQLCDVSQSEMSRAIGVDRSTISKLKSGKQTTLREEKCRELYAKLLNPKEKGSPVESWTEDELLVELKKRMEDQNLSDAISNLNGASYQSFVMGMFRQANGKKSNASKEKSKEPDKKQLQTEQGTDIREEPMLDVFCTLSKDFDVESFLYCKTENITPDRIRDMGYFIGQIDSYKSYSGELNTDREANRLVDSFRDKLFSYIKFLKTISVHPDSFPENFEIREGEKDGCFEPGVGYLWRLQVLYREINNKYKKILNEKRERQHAEFLAVWEEGSIKPII